MLRRIAPVALSLLPVCASAQAPAPAAPPAASAPPPARAGLVTERSVSATLAIEAATAAVEACAGRGWRAAAAVVDRAGQPKALVRGDGAAPHTIDSARAKAYTAATLRNNTTAVQEMVRTNPGASQLPAIPGLLILGGGIPLRVGDEVVGAIGVGGAPGGHLDDQCAEAGIARIRDRLQ
jgi:uncharacterized protein GlcG (DUF336 family)